MDVIVCPVRDFKRGAAVLIVQSGAMSLELIVV